MHDLIRDISFSIGAAWVLGLLAQFSRQPVLLAYLVGGFLLGPSGLRVIESADSIHAISELGLIFMLFMIGLEIDLKKIASAGRSITLTATVQIIGGTILGVLFFRLCGFALGSGHWDALYLATAGVLSSTVIIVKLLYDKRELDTLTGRITLGVLVIQDLAAILFLAVQPNLGNLAFSVLAGSLARVVLLVAAAMAVSRYLLPRLFRNVARLPELMQIGALAWCFLVGEFAERLHLSREMGALVAGVALSTFPYAMDVTAKVTSLRDFFITLFFVGLGMQIPLPGFGLIAWSVLFALFVVASRLATTFTPLYLMGHGLRMSVIPAINLAQVSEFSLVIVTMGAQFGHFESSSTPGIVALAFALLAAASTFGIMRSDQIIRQVLPWLKARGLRDLDQPGDDAHATGASGHGRARILFLGFFRTASSLLEEMQRHAPDLMAGVAVVDFSPVAREELVKRGIRVIYGDISQREILLHAGVDHAEVLIATLPDSLLKGISNERLVRLLRSLNPGAKIIATTEILADVEALFEAGADYVSIARLREAYDLFTAVRAATGGFLGDKRVSLKAILAERNEVLD